MAVRRETLDVPEHGAWPALLRTLAADAPSAPPAAPGGKPETFRMAPPAALLSRVAAFMPQIAAANARLAHQSEHEYSLEAVGAGEAHVALELGLGVFDVAGPLAHAAALGPAVEVRGDPKQLIASAQSSGGDSGSGSGSGSGGGGGSDCGCDCGSCSGSGGGGSRSRSRSGGIDEC